jgi:aspartyl-tRNA(Asn)/glutamyl-tRNA(Gln) amidotransferase subunit B
MSNPSYVPVIGMEVHAEVKTKSKMFCGCKNDPFHALEPNTLTCRVCLGLPGALPVANKQAIELILKLGLALHCKINRYSKFDRKNYFYPDLPKGYQISQYDLPFCYDGYLDTSFGRVKIQRIHLEEDTGKLLHTKIKDERVSLIDFNRSGVPLIEVVTDPDIHSAAQAKEYGQKLRELFRFLEVADCDMEQGGMRLEANISLKKDGEIDLPPYKVELKNINSFKFLEKAITYEMTRQEEVLRAGEMPGQETRGYDAQKGITYFQRSKGNAADYRYFPDPDLPPMEFTAAYIDSLAARLPELPAVKIERWSQQYGVEKSLVEDIFATPSQATWWEELFIETLKQKIEINKLVKAIKNHKLSIEVLVTEPVEIVADFIKMASTEDITAAEIESLITEVFKEHAILVTEYKAGKEQLLQFLLGQVMK